MRQRNAVWGSTVALALACGGAAAALQQKATTPDAILGEALHQEEAAGNLEAAIDGYTKVIADPSAGRQLVATALLHLGMSYAKLGHKDARATLERVTRDYADQTQIAAQASTRLAALGAAKVDDDTRVVARQVWVGDDVDPFGSPSPDGRFVRLFRLDVRSSRQPRRPGLDDRRTPSVDACDHRGRWIRSLPRYVA